MGWNDVERNKNADEDRIPYTKFEQGTTMIRVLDNEPHSFWSHWLPAQRTSVTCLGKGCPICNIIAQQKANNVTPTYSSSQRHAIRIWNYQTNKMEIMIQGRQFFSNLLALHREIGDITTYDIKINRGGEGTSTTYSMIPMAPKEFEVKDGITEVDMAEQFKMPTKEEMLQLIEGKTWQEINGENDAA